MFRKYAFGEKLLVLGGDLKQIFLIVPKRRWGATVFAKFTESEICNQCQVLSLISNVRILTNNLSTYARFELNQFAYWILEINIGKVPTVSFSEHKEPNWIKIPEYFLIKSTGDLLTQLVDATYTNLITSYKSNS